MARHSMNFVDHFVEPSRRRAALLWRHQPLEEVRGLAECREKDRVFADRSLVEGRDEIK